jgi:hypothetical protein
MQQQYAASEQVAAASNPNQFSVFISETNIFVSRYSGCGQFVRFILKAVPL